MKNDLRNERINKLVWAVAIPCMIGQIVNVLYSIVDRIYIGHLSDIGSYALAGVGICGPILTMVSSFASLVGVGGGTLCAIKLGEKDKTSAKKIISTSFNLLVYISIVIILICFPFRKKMLYAFGASDVTLPYALEYFSIYILGTPFALLSIGMNNYINCQGYSRLSMCSTLIGAITNIVLDPILMFGFNMGVSGAAIASICGQFISTCFVLIVLRSKKVEINLSIDRTYVYEAKEILKLGFNQFIIVAFDNVMIIALNSILNKYGGELSDVLIGANTIIQSFMLIVTMPLSGISSGTQCILSYNFGAYQTDRVKKAYYYIMKCCALYCAFMFIVVWLFGDKFIVLFNNDANILLYATKALRIYTLFIIPLGFQYELVDGMTALGQVKISLFLSFFRKSIYFISLFILPLFLEPIYVFLAESISDLIAPIVSSIVVKHNFDKIMERRLFYRDN